MGLRNILYNLTGIKLKKTTLPYELIEMACKKNDLSNCKTIKTIALGSSHGAYSFKADELEESFNLCSTSQDLYYSLQLYKYAICNQSDIRNVILFFSTFSTGFDLSKTSEKNICCYFKRFLDIDFKDANKELIKSYKKIKFMRVEKSSLPNSYNGFTHPDRFFGVDHSVETRANIHLREGQRKPDMVGNLIELINECKKNKHKLIIVLPPARDDYKKLIPVNMFDNIKDLLRSYNVKVIDLFNSSLFFDDDFGDFDHVNNKGAIKLTGIIKQQI